MRVGETIIIQTVDPKDTRYVNTAGKSTAQIYEEVKNIVIELYRHGENCFQEFIEAGELEISGMPLNLQVLLYAELKKMIDYDVIWIQSEDFGDSSLEQYLWFGPDGPEGK